MKNCCIVVCIGLPGAGKTTFCKMVQRKLCSREFLYINYDELSKGNYSTSTRKAIFLRVEALIDSLTDNKIVLIDDNMYYKSMRNEYVKLARTKNLSYLQIYFGVRLETALIRNAARTNDKIPHNVVREMSFKLEKPEKYTWYVDANNRFSDSLFHTFNDKLLEAVNQPLPSQDKITKANVLSEIHEIDLILRKIVAEKIKLNKDLVDKYVSKRKELLNRIRTNEIILPKECDVYQCLWNYLE